MGPVSGPGAGPRPLTMFYLQAAASICLTLGLVVLLHEFGHYLMCLKLGVRVERFAFGFGPELFGFTRSGTRFSICAFPLGGFVKPAGENPEESKGQPDEFNAQSWKGRLLIVYAGPAMNYLLAWGLFAGAIYVKGVPHPAPEPVIGNIMAGYPAQAGGLELDDAVTAVDGRRVETWDELAKTIHASPNKAVELTLRRKEAVLKRRVTPRRDDATGKGIIGIMPKSVYKPVPLTNAVGEGARQCWQITAFTVNTIVSRVAARQRPDLAGPIGIAQMVSRAARSGWEEMVFLMGLISVAIGFFNLLPVPLLDGGHAAFFIWEGISGRRPSDSQVAAANSVGLFLLLSLLVFATYNDVDRIRTDRRRAAESRAQSAPATP